MKRQALNGKKTKNCFFCLNGFLFTTGLVIFSVPLGCVASGKMPIKPCFSAIRPLSLESEYSDNAFLMIRACNVPFPEERGTDRESRGKLKEYFVSQNEAAFAPLKGRFPELSISDYAPFASLPIGPFLEDESALEELEGILEDEANAFLFDAVDLAPAGISENTGASLANLSLDNAKAMVNEGSINVYFSSFFAATFEEGPPIASLSFDGNITFSVDGFGYNGLPSQHATDVAFILGGHQNQTNGEDGFAPTTHILVCNYNEFVSEVNRLLNPENTDSYYVANCSFEKTESSSNYGKYLVLDSFLDYTSFLYGITYVCSAGNDEINRLTTTPSSALNAIAVGAVDADSKLSYFSSYAHDSSYTALSCKPTLVAPGENIVVPTNAAPISGTSFAAPIVSAEAVRLCALSSAARGCPELILSLLGAGASSLSDCGALFEPKCGRGLVDFSATEAILTDGHYRVFSTGSSVSQGDDIYSVQITVPANQNTGLSLAHAYADALRDWTYQVSLLPNPPVTAYQLRVYDAVSNSLVDSFSSIGNLAFGVIENDTNAAKTYRVVVYAAGNNVEGTEQRFALSWAPHGHSYVSSYVSSGPLTHKAYCACGDYVEVAHTFGPEFFQGGSFWKACTKCGQMKQVGGGMHPHD